MYLDVSIYMDVYCLQSGHDRSYHAVHEMIFCSMFWRDSKDISSNTNPLVSLRFNVNLFTELRDIFYALATDALGEVWHKLYWIALHEFIDIWIYLASQRTPRMVLFSICILHKIQE